MNKILVAVFDTETAAYEGLSALKELNASGDITLNATAVIAKSADGALGLRQAAEQGPGSTALGLITGSLIGLLAGPLGLALGATAGGLTGLLLDLRRAGMSEEFVQEVSEKLAPGKSAVLADMDETWTVPVDTRLEPLGAVVVRYLRAEVEEDQLNREAAQLKAERAQLKAEPKPKCRRICTRWKKRPRPCKRARKPPWKTYARKPNTKPPPCRRKSRRPANARKPRWNNA